MTIYDLDKIKHSARLANTTVPTPEICLAAVKMHGWSLRFVKEQTPEICLAAVTTHGSALHLVKEQTLEICLAAIRQNPMAINKVKRDQLSDSEYAELLLRIK